MDVIAICGDGDDGRSGVRFHSLVNGSIIRDFPRTSGWTDDVADVKVWNDYMYTRDTDSAISCFDTDGVFLSKVDVNYFANPSGILVVNSEGVFSIKKNKDTGNFTRLDNEAHICVVYEHETLQEIRRFTLNDPLFYDSGTNTSYLNPNRGVLHFPGDSYMWLLSTNPVDRWYKVSLADGSVINSGTEFVDQSPAAGAYRYWSIGAWDGRKWYRFDNGQPAIQDFQNYTSTVWTVPAEGAAQTVWSSHGSFATVGGTLSFTIFEQHRFHISGGRAYMIGTIENANDPSFPARDGQVTYGCIVSFDVADGSNIEINHLCPLYAYDGYKTTAGWKAHSVFVFNSVVLSPTTALYGSGRTFTLCISGVNAGHLKSTNDVQQEYSSDGEDCDLFGVITLPEYQVTGTITDTAGTTGRIILAYDDELPDHLISESVVNSPYSLTFFSQRPKRLICKSVDSSKNDKIASHIVPV